MDVVTDQSHDNCPGDYQSPILQFQAEELGSNGERAGHGFESKRHYSSCEGAQKLQNRRQQKRAPRTSPLFAAGPFTSDVCDCPDHQESSPEDAQPLRVAERVRKERSHPIPADLGKRGQSDTGHEHKLGEGMAHKSVASPTRKLSHKSSPFVVGRSFYRSGKDGSRIGSREAAGRVLLPSHSSQRVTSMPHFEVPDVKQ